MMKLDQGREKSMVFDVKKINCSSGCALGNVDLAPKVEKVAAQSTPLLYYILIHMYVCRQTESIWRE